MIEILACQNVGKGAGLMGEIPYKIERVEGKSGASLVMNLLGEVIVRAPISMPEAEIAEIVRKHRDWIERNKAKTNYGAWHYAYCVRNYTNIKAKEAADNEYQVYGVSYKIERSSRRKKVKLSADFDRRFDDIDRPLTVLAPKSMSDSEIAVEVKRQLDEMQTQSDMIEKYPIVTAENGSAVMFMGRRYIIDNSETKEADRSLKPDGSSNIYAGAARDTVILTGDKMLIRKSFGLRKLIDWLKDQAYKVLSERVSFYAGILKVRPSAVRLSDDRRRWGCCTHSNIIRFSWRVIQCPLEIIDYVVVHEMCHIIHKNHHDCFWAAVAGVLPDYEERKRWLTVNSRLMEVI